MEIYVGIAFVLGLALGMGLYHFGDRFMNPRPKAPLAATDAEMRGILVKMFPPVSK